MKPLNIIHVKPARILKQRGVVLFFALIALLAMSIAAVGLIRSIDTNTMIAGNLAFKQSATSSGDAGVEFAMNWLQAQATANAGLNMLTDATHPFNIDQPALGYYSSANPAKSLTAEADSDDIKWEDGTDCIQVPDDGSGNTTCVIIQRMCQNAGVAAGVANCLFGTSTSSGEDDSVALAPEVCETCPPPTGQTVQFRITSKSDAARNSVSYVQAFAY